MTREEQLEKDAEDFGRSALDAQDEDEDEGCTDLEERLEAAFQRADLETEK